MLDFFFFSRVILLHNYANTYIVLYYTIILKLLHNYAFFFLDISMLAAMYKKVTNMNDGILEKSRQET